MLSPTLSLCNRLIDYLVHPFVQPVIPMVSYHASKAAVLQLARSIACEHALSGIRVNTISPSAVSTPYVFVVTSFYTCITSTYYLCGLRMASSIPPDTMESIVRSIPLGRIGQPHELRGAMTWLASDASSFCTGSEYVTVIKLRLCIIYRKPLSIFPSILVSGGHTASGV